MKQKKMFLKQSMIWKTNKTKFYWLSLFISAAPCKEVCGWEAPCLFTSDSPNRVRGLNDLFLGASISKVGLLCVCQGSLTFSVAEEHSELPFNEIMPRGPGIVSIRDV